jgi:ubiquinone/menaquinone biosynthesis C-methylase UbiE
VLEYAGARPGDRILDVGAGTGRATRLLAERGYEVVAIEPDREMAAVASKRAATAGQSIEVLTCDFEQASLPESGFRIVISATAWHWVTPRLRSQLAARVLVPGGALAPFWNRPRCTHSDHTVLPEAPRERLYTVLPETIDAAGGSFGLTYQTLLLPGPAPRYLITFTTLCSRVLASR